MARGKHADRAAATRARTEAEAAVTRLERENAKLRDDLATARQDVNDTLATMAEETKRLRLLVAAGTSDVVQERDRRIAELVEERNQERNKLKKADDVRDKVTKWLIEHFKTEHGMTGADAVQELVHAVGQAGYVSDVNLGAKAVKGRFDVDDLEKVEVAMGIRSKASVDRNRARDVDIIESERPW